MDFNKVFHIADEGIGREQFLAAYDKYPPNGFIKFAFKYFSRTTKPEDLWATRVFQAIEIALFLTGLLGSILNWNKLVMGILLVLFSSLLLLLILYLFIAVIVCNNLRIRKIRKELGGITKSHYNSLVNLYMD